jgi:hypothetical protein
MPFTRLLDAVRARPAVLVAAGLVLVCLLGFFGALRPRPAASSGLLYTNSATPTVTTLVREAVPVVAVAPKPPPTPTAPAVPPKPMPPAPPAPTRVAAVKPIPPLKGVNFHCQLPPETNLPPLGVYAPAGRLLRCQLVNTVDSGNTDTPIIGLVTDDLWHDGHLVVPVGTEVHSRVRVDRSRERLLASGLWTLVWQTGEELVVHGVALERGEQTDGQKWELIDGRAGLSGEVQGGDPVDQVKLIVATIVSGMASGMQQTRETIVGTQIVGNIRNSALSGSSQVLNAYAQQILEAIKRDGPYVRVPAGKQMYLYLTDTLDLSQARIGNLRVAARPAPLSFPNLNPDTKL